MRLPTARISVLVGACVVLGISLAACGSTTTSSASTAVIKPPATIAKGGMITFCTDASYPPVEFYRGSTIVGSEPELASKIAKLMGVKAVMRETNFASIISALQAGDCDAIASGLFETAQRAAVVRFVTYGKNGDGLMVQAGNPDHVTGYNKSLAGKTIGIESGLNVIPGIQAFCAKLSPACSVVLYPGSTDVAEALKTGKVDVDYDGATSQAYYKSKDESAFQLVPGVLSPSKVGMAVNKDNGALQKAMQQAVAKLYSDGQMCSVLKTWGVTLMAEAGHSC